MYVTVATFESSSPVEHVAIRGLVSVELFLYFSTATVHDSTTFSLILQEIWINIVLTLCINQVKNWLQYEGCNLLVNVEPLPVSREYQIGNHTSVPQCDGTLFAYLIIMSG